LPPLAEHATVCSSEDAAVLVPEVAVITRPAPPRVAMKSRASLPRSRGTFRWRRVTGSGVPRGGDVLRIGRRSMSGLRAHEPGRRAQLARFATFGYAVREVALHDCCTEERLHLYSAERSAGQPVVDRSIGVDVGAVIAVTGRAVCGQHPELRGLTWLSKRLSAHAAHSGGGRNPHATVDVRELHKAEAALTCMSLLLEPAAALSYRDGAQRLEERSHLGSVPIVIRHQVS